MAKTTKMRRKDLIQPDQFISTTDIIIAYCTEHKTKIVFATVSLILIFFSALWFKHNQNQNRFKMESLFFKLEQVKASRIEDSIDKIKQMEALLEKFNKGPQKQRALLLLADEYFNEGRYDKAINLYQNILKESSSPLSHQLANIGIAYSHEGKKDYKNAINAYKTVIQFPNNEYPLFDIYTSLVRCYELNNQKNEALLILREMQSKFSNNPKINEIDIKIKNIDI